MTLERQGATVARVADDQARQPAGPRGTQVTRSVSGTSEGLAGTDPWNYGLAENRLRVVLQMIREHEDDMRAAWRRHFGR